MMDIPKTIGNKDVASKLGMSLSTWYKKKHTQEFRIPHYMLENRYLESDVDAFIQERRQQQLAA